MPNFLVGATSNGTKNGISFFEGSTGFGMKFGYDGSSSGVNNKLAMYNDTNQEIIVFENGGNVGIAKANPTQLLDVDGSALFETNANATPLYVGRSEDLDEAMSIGVEDASAIFFSNQDESSGDYGNFRFIIDNDLNKTPRFAVEAKSETSDNPLLGIYINGIVNLRSLSPYPLSLILEGDSTATNQSEILFRQRDASVDSARIRAIVTGADDDEVGLSIWTHPSSTGTNQPQEMMRLTDEGNLGIGTTSPSHKVAIVGDLNVTGTVYYSALQAQSPILKRTSDPFVAECTTASNGDFVVEYVRANVDDTYERAIEKVDSNSPNWWHRECFEKNAKIEYLDSLRGQKYLAGQEETEVEIKEETMDAEGEITQTTRKEVVVSDIEKSYDIYDLEMDWSTKQVKIKESIGKPVDATK